MDPRDNDQNLRSPKYMKITLQVRRVNFDVSSQLVQKFILMQQAMKIPDAKAAVEKDWKEPDTIPAWELDKVKNKKHFSGSTTRHCKSFKSKFNSSRRQLAQLKSRGFLMAKRSEPRREVRDESAVCGAARQGVATTANKTPLVPRTSELE